MFPPYSPLVETTLKEVDETQLPHPDGELVRCFLEDAVDGDMAAEYLRRRCSGSIGPSNLNQFLIDWRKIASEPFPAVIEQPIALVEEVQRRDGDKCCISRQGPSPLDPLIVSPIFPERQREALASLVRHDSGLEAMMSAFFTPALSKDIFQSDFMDPVRQHWLLRKSAAQAFSQGYFQVEFIDEDRSHEYDVCSNYIGGPEHPAIVEYTSTRAGGRYFRDSSMPDLSSIKFISHLSRSIRWLHVAREIAERPTRGPSSPTHIHTLSSFRESLMSIARLIWVSTPVKFRFQMYRLLDWFGQRMYGVSRFYKVQRLPFGLYLKASRMNNRERLMNEAGALALVHKHCGPIVPRPLDLVTAGGIYFLLMTKIPGCHLGLCIDTLTDEELESIMEDLKIHLLSLRTIPKTVAPAYAITNAIGTACRDFRIMRVYDSGYRGDYLGPWRDEDEFNTYLTTSALPDVNLRSDHSIVFTHGDINMRNIMVHDGRFSGIVDWETAGWFPEYWDYTKARFITKLHRRFLRALNKMFADIEDYSGELEVEQKLWEACF